MFGKLSNLILSAGAATLLVHKSWSAIACDVPQCARVVIDLEAGGERGFSPSGKVVEDNDEGNLKFILKGFVKDSPIEIPALVISSSSYATSNNPSIAELSSRDAGIGVIPNSLETFQRLGKQNNTADTSSDKVIPISNPAKSPTDSFKNDTYLYALRKKLSENPACQALMNQYPGADISRFVKVETLFASGHSDFNDGKYVGIATWKSDGDHGSVLESEKIGTQLDLTRDFQFIRNAFPEATYQAVAGICGGENVGDDFQKAFAGNCSCYGAFTRKDVSVNSYSDTEPNFLARHEKDNTEQGKWKGASSLTSLMLPKFKTFRTSYLTHSNEHQDFDPIFAEDLTRINPYDNYNVTSADIAAEDILAKAKPVNVKKLGGDPTSGRIVSDIDIILKTQQAEHEKFIEQNPRDIQDFRVSWAKANKYYSECVRSHDEKSDCGQFSQFIDDVFKDQLKGDDPEGSLGLANLNEFRNYMKTLGDEGTQKAISKNPLSFLPKMQKNFVNFANMRNNFYKLALRWQREGKITEEKLLLLKSSLKSFSEIASNYFTSYLNAYFPDLLRDTLQRRRDTIKKAAEYLAAQYRATNDKKYLHKLENLYDNVHCATDIAIGPMFDRRLRAKPEEQKLLVHTSEIKIHNGRSTDIPPKEAPPDNSGTR